MNRSNVSSILMLASLAGLAGVIALVGKSPEATPLAAAEPAVKKLTYNKDIRPILSENCFACHGPDSAARKADLRLDLRGDAVEKQAIVPGKPDKSEAIIRILMSEKEEGVMPPVKTHKKMTPAQKDTLKRWISEGAEYEAHWSFITPTKPVAPKVKDEKWVRNPIDAFVLAELETRGLTPAPEADRRTLARRLSLDIVGLPPSIEDVEAFVNDKDANWYEKYIDKLMKSPHYGEHRARYWLDAARFADTHGIHFDNYRENWSYREWVIRAFNENKKFDQFTIEQLAGDLLPNTTIDQKVATGFNRCNITTNEGGAIAEEYLVLYNRDRTETVGQVWMGLTAGCAVCHNHKFDPITTKDFYSMAAFFNNTTQNAMDGNIQNTPPVIPVPKLEDRDQWVKVKKDLESVREKLTTRKAAAKADFEKWTKTADTTTFTNQVPTEGLVFHAKLNETKGTEASYLEAGKTKLFKLTSGYGWTSDKDLLPGDPKPKVTQPGLLVKATGDLVGLPDVGNFDVKQAFTVSTWVFNGKRNQIGAILSRMDDKAAFRGWDMYIQQDKIGFHLINAFPQNALKIVTKNQLKIRDWQHVVLTYDGSTKAAGARIYIDGELQPVTVENDSLKATTLTKAPFKIGSRNSGDSRVANVGVSDLRIYDRELPALQASSLAGSQKIADLLKKDPTKRTPSETDQLFNYWLTTNDETYKATATEERKLQQEEVAIQSRGTIAHISVEKPSMPEAFILTRGEYDKRAEKVAPATPKVLPKFDDDLPKNRLGFAKWLLKKDQPLTARVTVNRFWQEIFGTGIVRTSGDFGITGDLPSHPALLDWLAEEFESDWDMQRILKLILTSSTYRQAAIVTKDKLEKDLQNRYLSRGPRFRMDAEMIRDYALSASGLLVPKLGGPSVKPYQPVGVWEAVAMIGSNTRNYTQDKGENLYRRSMYTFWKRAAPPASMEIFNAPNRETCAVKRERTNTPIQALVTLNDPQFVEAARNLAEKTIKQSTKTDERIQFIARKLLARPFTDKELPIVTGSIEELLKEFKAKPDEARKLISVGESKADDKLDPGELAAWTMLCNELFNLDEVLNK